MAAAAAVGAAGGARSWAAIAATPAANAGACLLTPQSAEGPYYFDPRLERADIRDGRPGALLKLSLRVAAAGSCAPLAGARVDVWHADALGAYSGYDRQTDRRDQSTVGRTFLRGTLIADRDGLATFTTIYPGWYPGRTPHIHLKVFLDRRTVLIGQAYLPDDVSDFVYANAVPYNRRIAKRDTTNATDGLLRASGGDRAAYCNVKKEGDHYSASLFVGVDGARGLVPRRT
jgi:protocatechuate 3,4-dioxygenase beta subunit